MKRERRSFDLVDALTDGGQQRYSLRGGAAVSQSTSTPHTLSDKLSSTHREELEIIWNSDKRTPSLASRKAWSVARGIDHKVVNGWFSHKRHHAVHRYGQSVPKGTYELHPGAPKGQHHNTDKLTRTRKERDLMQLKIKRERASSPGVVSRPSSTAPPRNTRPRKKIKIESGIQIIKHTRAHESVPNPHCLTCTQNSFPSIRSPVHERDDRLFSPATSAHHRTPELSLGHRSSDVDYDADTETLTPLPSGDEGEVQIAGQPSTVFTAGASKVSSLAASSVTRTTLDLLTSFSGQELLFVDPGRSKNGAYTQPKPSPRESKAVKFASSVSLLGDFAASNLPSVNHSGPSLSGSLSTLDRVKQSYNLPPRQFRKSALVNHLKPITGSLPVSLIPNPQAFLSPPFSGPSASTDNTQSSASAVFASVSTHMKNTNARSVLDIPVKYRRLHAYTDFAQNAIRNLPEDSTSHTTFACNVSVAALTQPASSTVASNVASNSLRTSALANSCALIAMDTPSTSVVDDVMPLPLHDHVSTKASDADRSLPIHTPGLLASPSRFRVRDNAPPAHEIETNDTPAVEATLALLPVKCEPIVLQIPVIPAEVIEAPHATDVATPAHPTSSSAVKKIAIKVEVLSDSDDEPLVVVMDNRRATKENIPAPPRIPKVEVKSEVTDVLARNAARRAPPSKRKKAIVKKEGGLTRRRPIRRVSRRILLEPSAKKRDAMPKTSVVPKPCKVFASSPSKNGALKARRIALKSPVTPKIANGAMKPPPVPDTPVKPRDWLMRMMPGGDGNDSDEEDLESSEKIPSLLDDILSSVTPIKLKRTKQPQKYNTSSETLVERDPSTSLPPSSEGESSENFATDIDSEGCIVLDEKETIFRPPRLCTYDRFGLDMFNNIPWDPDYDSSSLVWELSAIPWLACSDGSGHGGV